MHKNFRTSRIRLYPCPIVLSIQVLGGYNSAHALGSVELVAGLTTLVRSLHQNVGTTRLGIRLSLDSCVGMMEVDIENAAGYV